MRQGHFDHLANLPVAQVVSRLKRLGAMAENVLMRIVDLYLADYRTLFRMDEEMQQGLLDTLDTFVQAGSEGARRLSYGLDGIYR